MRPLKIALGASVVFLFIAIGCHKPSSVIDAQQGGTPTSNNDTTKNPPVTPPVTTPGTPKQPGTWECDVDGVHYTGTIDTGFVTIQNLSYSHPDTVFTCTGISLNKGANMRLRFVVNRYSMPTGDQLAYLTFDTCTTNYLYNYPNANTARGQADSLKDGCLYGSFSGTLTEYEHPSSVGSHTITNGKFKCNYNTGNSEPKAFSFSTGAFNVAGYFNYARVTSNTLILDGIPFAYGSDHFKLMIRTGGTIKPGVYESTKGDVGLQWFVPSIYRAYVNDSVGDVKVTIASVTGNIVLGSFTGRNNDGSALTGNFSCRIKNYQPQADSVNKWSFGEDESIFLYRMFGGNVLNAKLSQNGGKYLLTLNGESDFGQSVFKMVISSNAQIAAGTYESGYMINSNKVDSLYFRSPDKIWNGNDTYLFIDDFMQNPVYCKIESIDQYQVTGTLSGKMRIFLSSSGYSGAFIKEGKFRASFYP
jgi:hypothetical protein